MEIMSRYARTLRSTRNSVFLIVSLGVVLSVAVKSSHAQAGPEKSEATYVTFQFLGEEDKGTYGIRDLPELVSQVKREFGAQPPGGRRYIGFTPGVFPLLNESASVIKDKVVQALDLAEQTGLPVLIHLDDMHFWYKRPDLFQDPEVVEWSAFPQKGTIHGPIVPRLFINWDRLTAFPTPPPCLDCPKFRAEVKDRLMKCVAEPIVARLAQWQAKGKAYLFAGIGIGNETQVPDYRGYAMSKPGDEPEVIEETSRGPRERRMRREEMVRAGYASLNRRGYTSESLERSAKQQGKSADDLTNELLYAVAHDYAEFRAKTLVEAGIPVEKLYTHFTSTFRPFMDKLDRSAPTSVGTGGVADLPPPVQYSVNRYSRPGFTVSHDHVDLADLVAQIKEAKGEGNSDRTWGVIESYATTGQPGIPQTQQQYEAYLGGLFANGARVVNVLGWTAVMPPPEATFAIKRAPGVMQAIREWVKGKNLPTAWTRSDFQDVASSVRKKMQRVQDGIRVWQSTGRDVSPVAKIMQEFEPLMRQGKLKEAEGILDRALAFVEAR